MVDTSALYVPGISHVEFAKLVEENKKLFLLLTEAKIRLETLSKYKAFAGRPHNEITLDLIHRIDLLLEGKIR